MVAGKTMETKREDMNMREVTVKLYKFHELSDESKARALDKQREFVNKDTYHMDEIVDSLKGLFKAAGVKLTDWSLGSYNRYNHVDFDMGDAGDLKGPRAMAWIENNLLAGLRHKAPVTVQQHKDYKAYGYTVGAVNECPFTGICYDMDFLDALLKDVKDGETLKDAFRGLADVCGKLIEDEHEYRLKDSSLIEDIEANDYEYTEDGELA